MKPYSTQTASVTVVITADPIFSVGIEDFIITYVSDTQLDLDWVYGTDGVNIMIRAKYGEYPDDIPDEDTMPSDGYLVYYGSATSYSDTSMNFDENAGMLYYKAWAQKADGTWILDTSTGYKESEIMTLLFFAIIAIGLSWFGLKTTYWILKFLAGASWFALLAYWKTNMPSAIVTGSSTDTIVTVLLIFVGLAMMFSTFWYSKNDNGMEVGRGFRLPFMNHDDEEEIQALPTHTERVNAYRKRVNSRLKGGR